jgi:hypothetical protein
MVTTIRRYARGIGVIAETGWVRELDHNLRDNWTDFRGVSRSKAP